MRPASFERAGAGLSNDAGLAQIGVVHAELWTNFVRVPNLSHFVSFNRIQFVKRSSGAQCTPEPKPNTFLKFRISVGVTTGVARRAMMWFPGGWVQGFWSLVLVQVHAHASTQTFSWCAIYFRTKTKNIRKIPNPNGHSWMFARIFKRLYCISDRIIYITFL